MASIEILKEKLIEGKRYNSLAAMCQELALINGKPCAVGIPLGNYQNKIEREIRRYAEISIEQTAKGKRKPVTIKKVFSTQQAPPSIRKSQSDIAEYLRPVLNDMVNKGHQDNCFVKYHRGLTVDLRYMGNGYIELYNAFYYSSKNGVSLSIHGIQDKEGYASYATGKLIDKMKRHINYYCENLNYNGVATYKTHMRVSEGERDFMDYADQKLLDEFKTAIKEEMERESKKPNYRIIPQLAAEKFNKYKQGIDPNYKTAGLFDAWTFEIRSGFIPKPQKINLKYLNNEILKGFLNSIQYEALLEYSKSQEYQDIKAASLPDFGTYDPELCSDKDVRQALTINKRDNTAEKKDIDERMIMLDFPIIHIDSYLNDILIIKNACQI